MMYPNKNDSQGLTAVALRPAVQHATTSNQPGCARVGVLLAVKDGARYLAQQIESILAQQAFNDSLAVHLFVFDDCSTDASLEILESYTRRGDRRITMLQLEPGAGGSAGRAFLAMILAIDLADLDYVALCDQDDIWLDNKLASAVRGLIDHGADGYSCDLAFFAQDGSRAGEVRKPSRLRKYDYIFQTASAGCTYVLTRAAVEVARERIQQWGQDLPFFVAHDWLLYAIVRSSGLQWVHDPHCYVLYRQHENNVWGYRTFSDRIRRQAKSRIWYSKNITLTLDVCKKSVDMPLASFTSLGLLGRLRFVASNWRELRREPAKAVVLSCMLLAGYLP